ncbi:MAG TPA: glyoxalase superfamily protein [Terriglobales bacterium]|nr:glyoxalase superfamily protein [Terriglobales bacterium]
MPSDWIARSVFRVADVAATLRFYADQLGFASPWNYEEDGKIEVAQVERDGVALILASNLANTGKGRIFVSVNLDRGAQTTALDALRDEWEAKGVEVKDNHWGYRVLVITDPDGNQILFNYPT